MMKKLLTVLCAAVGMTTLAASTYKTPAYSCGTVDRAVPNQSTFLVPNEKVLAFEGLTIKELYDEPYVIRAMMCGGQIDRDQVGYLYNLTAHSDGNGGYDALVGSFNVWDNDGWWIKSVCVRFTDGEGGVYVEPVDARYFENGGGANQFFQFVGFDGDGNLEFYGNRGSPADWYDGVGYGIAGMEASKAPPLGGKTVAFESEDGITLEDIASYGFTALMCGNPISWNIRDRLVNGYQKQVVRDGDDKITAIRIEFQVTDNEWLKCDVVEFTEEDGKIMMQALGAGYIGSDTPPGALAFCNSSGVVGGNPSSPAYSAKGQEMNGYGVYEIMAIPPDPQTIEVSSSCLWSDLAALYGIGDAFVSKLTIRVTSEGAILTFDHAVKASEVEIVAADGVSSFYFSFATGSFSADSLSVPAGLRFQIPVVATVGQIPAYSVGAGATLALAGSGNLNLESTISGEGALEIASGNFNVNKSNSYSGGTYVIGQGTVLRASISAGNYPFGAFSTDITIMNGGIFDIAGQYDYHAYRFVVDGGTLRNSGQYDGSEQVSGYGDIILKTDATIQCEGRALIGGPGEKPTIVDLGGHTLTAHFGGGASHLYVNNVVFTNGLVKFDSGSFLRTIRVPVDCSTASFDMFSGIDLYQDMEVSNFTYRLTDNWSIDPEPAGKMKVHGTFLPLYDYFANTEMCDGSTLDLTGKTGAWNTTVTRKDGYKHFCTFAEGATVTVDLTGREIANGDQIIVWDAAPEEVSFVAKGSAFGLGKRANGLYAVRGGLVIIVK